MTNYIKSEIYRILHTKTIFIFTLVLSLLSLSAILLLFFMNQRYGTDFRYGHLSFFYANLTFNPMLFPTMGSLLAFLLYEQQQRNGSLYNTLSFGISRRAIFLSNSLITTMFSVISMLIILFITIGGAELLLEQRGNIGYSLLLLESIAMIPISIAAILSVLLLLEYSSTTMSMVIWSSIWLFIPRLLSHFRFQPIIKHLTDYLPAVFLANGGLSASATSQETNYIWTHSAGFLKCYLVGGIACLLLVVIGSCSLAKKDLK